ncbi:hypothetical protein MUS1_01385 [Marinomonas ushuaiensis DSM 15871]|uniref:GGDEF domain-containing protein n=1 Tax=Marinomonas ushuaiensis DSM 15871 TaxID=1122207 RepID=X7E9P2_9GAMM|nr:diguanylate cyclase [Marinomonas ushuaiensis]ETX12672.1 hypothetical protein MUS1_01385 [Marinomonas ushuaiensis DSM 15871]
MTIKSRFLIFTALILLTTSFFSWLSMQMLAEGIIASWVERYAEKQVKYDKVRTLLPLIQEVNLSKEFAELESLKAWAKQPYNDVLKQQAFDDTEAFRSRFSDNSYFIALRGSERYYYSDDSKYQNTNKDESEKEFYRYTLDQNKTADSWFYSIIDIKLNLHLNVNPDVELGVVKLWSDVLIRDGEDILGVVGTGLDLTTFLSKMVNEQDIYSAIVFTDHDGSIQLYQKEELIDYASITKQSNNKKQIFQLLDDDSSREQLQKSFELAKLQPDNVEMARVNKDGVSQLASVIYIAEIDWFQVNFIDINSFLPWTEFSSLLVVFLISLVCALVTIYVLITLIITKPLNELERSICSLEKGKYHEPKLNFFAGREIKRLISKYKKISLSLLEYQQELEQKVIERTEKLDHLSKLDPLTSLFNRRGFKVHMTQYIKNWQDHHQPFSLINVDINQFKKVNDEYGHAVGDLLLQRIADYLKNIVGNGGEVSRWGGDEFLILVKGTSNVGEDNTDLSILNQLLSERESLSIEVNSQEVLIAFSVGSTEVKGNDSLEDMLNRADKAMYSMKFSRKG